MAFLSPLLTEVLFEIQPLDLTIYTITVWKVSVVAAIAIFFVEPTSNGNST